MNHKKLMRSLDKIQREAKLAFEKEFMPQIKEDLKRQWEEEQVRKEKTNEQ